MLSTDYAAATMMYYDIKVLVNNEVQSDASNIMEGATLLVIFRTFGLYAPQTISPDCATIFHSSKGRIGCLEYNQCYGFEQPSRTIVLSFMPVKLSDNGTNIQFYYTSFYNLDPIIITGEYT